MVFYSIAKASEYKIINLLFLIIYVSKLKQLSDNADFKLPHWNEFLEINSSSFEAWWDEQ